MNQPSQVVAATGAAVATAARVGGVLGRAGLQLAQRLVDKDGGADAAPAQRRHGPPDAAELRRAMGELLDRSAEATRTESRAYLYRTIIAQLVPDEARIIAALADGSRFAAADVVCKPLRGDPVVLLANVSTIGRRIGLATPGNTPAYLSRLAAHGLVEFCPEEPKTASLAGEYDALAADSTVTRVRENLDARRRRLVRLQRKIVFLSPFGHDFWTAANPDHPAANPDHPAADPDHLPS